MPSHGDDLLIIKTSLTEHPYKRTIVELGKNEGLLCSA